MYSGIIMQGISAQEDFLIFSEEFYKFSQGFNIWNFSFKHTIEHTEIC